MIFDIDVIIWVQRGNLKAAKLVQNANKRYISVQTYMELLQCTRSKTQHQITKAFLKDGDFKVLPFTESIGHRAAIYVEEYSLGHDLRAGDAIIAATAVENHLILSTSNQKHFKMIQDLQLKVLKP